MTASNFGSVVLPFTLRYEGGRSDNPRDPGGRTMEGVTQATFTAWLAKQGKPSRDVFTITDAERDAIYCGGFWAPVKGDALPDGVDLAVFDYAVNSGPARALKAYAARTSNEAGSTVRTVCGARLSFLHALGTFKVFGKGWAARVAACEALGVKMAEHASIGVPVAAPTTPATATKLVVAGRQAAAKAVAHKRRATGALTIAGAGAATQAPGAPSAALPITITIMLMVMAGLGIAWLAWRAHVAAARASAYAAVAVQAVTPSTPGAR